MVNSGEVKGICLKFTLLYLCVYMPASAARAIKKSVSIFTKFLYYYLCCFTTQVVENILPLSCWPQDPSLDGNYIP